MHTDRVISMDTGENIGGSINLIEPCYQNLENVITLTIRRAQIRTIGIDFTDQKAKNQGLEYSPSVIDTLHWARVLLHDQKRFGLKNVANYFNISLENKGYRYE